MRQETNGAEWSDESGDDVDDKQFRVMIKFQSAPPADDDNPHGPMLLSFCFRRRRRRQILDGRKRHLLSLCRIAQFHVKVFRAVAVLFRRFGLLESGELTKSKPEKAS